MLSPLFTDRALQIIAENKIRAAIEAGEFNNLPSLGKPAAIFDEPYDPHWWIRRKLRRESLTVDPQGLRLTTKNTKDTKP